MNYSPERRTAVVLCGTGAHGAYHAGVLRALHEAGVKVDLAAGHGVGAGAAALTAIDGASRLWDDDGLWKRAAHGGLYHWKPLLVTAGWIAAVLVLVLATPIIVLLATVAVTLVGFLLQLVGLAAGASLVAWSSATLQTLFTAEHLPTSVPRVAMVVLAALVLVAFVGVAIAQWRAPVSRRAVGGWWWRLAGAPLDAAAARQAFATAIWQLIRGAARPERPSTATIGRRYAEVLSESLGQPGFRELIVVASDLDARRDVVAALLREPFRHEFQAPRPGRDRRAEILDLAGGAGVHAFDMIGAALTPPLVCDPALVTFSSESFWRGETHRLCDRPGATSRLLEEVAAAGVSQVIVVSAVAPASAPHTLSAPRLDIRNRLGDFMVAAECAALRDALEMARLRFDSVYLITPHHNPVGAFDFDGAYDQASDRKQGIGELIDRASEDAYRQFIEPIVGASGEQLVRETPLDRPSAAKAPQAPPHDLLFDDIDP